MRAWLVILAALALSGPPILAAAADAAKPAPATAPAALVDLNRATLPELVALKGIGEARAAAIVKGRPYARKDDLVRRGIIPQSVYDEIREQIVARQ